MTGIGVQNAQRAVADEWKSVEMQGLKVLDFVVGGSPCCYPTQTAHDTHSLVKIA